MTSYRGGLGYSRSWRVNVNDWINVLPLSCSKSLSLYVFLILYVLNMIKHALRRPLANAAKSSVITKRYAHAPVAFNWEDPLGTANLFTEEEMAIQETANSYCQERMLPRVLGLCPSIVTVLALHLQFFQMRIGMNIMTARSSKRWESWAFWGLRSRVTTAQVSAALHLDSSPEKWKE